MDELEPLGDAETGLVRSIGFVPWDKLSDADSRALWWGRHYPRSVAGPKPAILEEDVGPMALIV